MNFRRKDGAIGQVTIGSKPNPICVPSNLAITVPGQTNKIPPKITCLFEQAQHHNLPLGIGNNRCVATTKARSVPVILVNTTKQNVWIWQPLLAMVLFSTDQIEEIEYRASMERQGDNIHISFSPVAPDSIRLKSEQVESITPDITPPTSNDKPSFGPRPDVKATNFDFQAEINCLPFKLNMGTTVDMTHEQQRQLINIIYDHPEVFSLHDEDLGFCDKIKHMIPTTLGRPVYLLHHTIPPQLLGVIVANNPMDLMCIDFTKVDPSKDGKENILVLTDVFAKFSQAFVTSNQKVITIAKILVDRWFYVYGIPACIHSDKGHSFDNEIMSHLYAMYRVEQSITMPYNLHGNAPMERLNHTLIGLLKSLPKEQKSNWLLHLPLLVFAYNAMPYDTTGYQPYELMFGHKALTICNAWLGLGNYNDNFLQSKCAWLNQQHELILTVNRWVLKRIKLSAEKSVSWAGGKALKIPIGNLVLLGDHPKGHNKIQDNYKLNCLS